jgi:hypothetical protein
MAVEVQVFECSLQTHPRLSFKAVKAEPGFWGDQKKPDQFEYYPEHFDWQQSRKRGRQDNGGRLKAGVFPSGKYHYFNSITLQTFNL